MRINYVIRAFSITLKYIGWVTLLPMIVALYYKEYYSVLAFFDAGIIALLLGLLLKLITNRINPEVTLNDIKRSEALSVVALSWMSFGLIAAIPFMHCGFSFIDSLFEAVSGITTSGGSIFVSFDVPKTILFWRSFTQWVGGMGIIVLFVAVLPQFAVAGRQMFFAEAPGPTEDKFTPRIRNTASVLWIVYAMLTLLCALLLHISGMPKFDSICNAFSTLSAGGYSPNPLSIGGYHSNLINWIIIFFMFISGASFVLQSRVIAKRKPSLFWKSEEFRIYTYCILALSTILIFLLIFQNKFSIFHAVTSGFYNVIAMATSTGSANEDFELWSYDCKIILYIAMFVSSCSGSTGGGLKMTRWLILFKYLKNELYKILHPKTVLTVKIDNKVISNEVIRQTLFFVLCFFTIWAISVLFLGSLEKDLALGLSVSISALGDIGPGIGSGLGPYGTYAHLTEPSKIIFIIDMLIGRLEIIPFLLLLHKDFWSFKK